MCTSSNKTSRYEQGLAPCYGKTGWIMGGRRLSKKEKVIRRGLTNKKSPKSYNDRTWV